jgi:hypothetical protein
LIVVCIPCCSHPPYTSQTCTAYDLDFCILHFHRPKTFVVCCFETGSCSVSQAVLKLLSSLEPPDSVSSSWDYRGVQLCLPVSPKPWS